MERCWLFDGCPCKTAGCWGLPDQGCPVYRWFEKLIRKGNNMDSREELIEQYKEALKEAQNLYLAQDHTEAEIEKRKEEDINKLEKFIKIIHGL